MIDEIRELYNANFTERKFAHFLERLDHRCRTRIPFRVCETPFFVPKHIQTACEEAAIELTLQAHSPEYLSISDRTLRPEHTVAGQPSHAMFMTVDFAMAVGDDGEIVPRLIELQGFPSLMGFQLAFAELMQEHFELPESLGYLNGGHTRQQFLARLHRAIIADKDPENVVLMELDPWEQKTCCDFHMIHELLGIEVVDIRSVEKIGRALHYRKDGRSIPIERVYNRAIVDELERKNVQIPFDWHDDLDIEWAGHPNWYFRISKFTLPFLDHPTVPETTFLDRLVEIPDDLENYVLKPLYSFAGAGVVVSPTREEVDAVAPERRDGYVLQKKVQYAEAIRTPQGGTKAELRVMLIWLPGEEKPAPVIGLVRMGRGKMMGVDHNRDLTWIGAGCNYFE